MSNIPNSPSELFNLNKSGKSMNDLPAAHQSFEELNLNDALNFIEACLEQLYIFHRGEYHEMKSKGVHWGAIDSWERDAHHLRTAYESLKLVARGSSDEDDDDEVNSKQS